MVDPTAVPSNNIIEIILPALTVLVGAIAAAAVRIIQALRETHDSVTAAAQTATLDGAVRNAKLDNITVLVNGRYSEVLRELAAVKQILADRTGLAVDQIAAEIARKRAADQDARVMDMSTIPNRPT